MPETIKVSETEPVTVPAGTVLYPVGPCDCETCKRGETYHWILSTEKQEESCQK